MVIRAGAGLAAGRAALIEPQAGLSVCLRPVQAGGTAPGLCTVHEQPLRPGLLAEVGRTVLEDRQVGIGGVGRHLPHGGMAVVD